MVANDVQSIPERLLDVKGYSPNLNTTSERLLSLLLLVIPGIIGVVYGVLGIVRKESKIWIAYLGILLNVLFALFHLFVVSFAG